MDERPNTRRWLQFHLSTWVVLVGIASWAMATRPILIDSAAAVRTRLIAGPGWTRPGIFDFWITRPQLRGLHFSVRQWWHYTAINESFCRPIMVLTAFVGWKSLQSLGVKIQRKTAVI